MIGLYWMSIVVVGLYGLMMLVLSFQLFRWMIANTQKQKQNAEENIRKEEISCSVIVPFRNEARALPTLLDSLRHQTLSHQQFEVILVNDHSTDRFQENLELPINFKLIGNDGEGKKAAILTGIKAAQHQHIVQTDADCTHAPDWLKYILFDLQEADLVAGPALFRNAKWQNLELMSYVGVSTATIAMHTPVLSNGANLAYRKQDFETLRPFQNNAQISSGDDQAILFAFSQAGKRVAYATSERSLVWTNAETRFKDILQQRLRWAGKTSKINNRYTLLLGGLTLLANFSIVLLAIATIFTQDWKQFALIFLTKAAIDFLFLLLVAIQWKVEANLFYYPFVALLYPFYLIAIVPLSLLVRPKWKNRKVTT